jgi:acetolactate synthase-1/2/3 large subunit
MGAGLPSAIVASMLYPERRMLAVCGDGGLMMNSREMETAAPLGLNLVVLILQDNAYGIIRGKQAVDGFANWGLSFGNPNFREVCRGVWRQGLAGEVAGGLAPTLEAAFNAGGLHIVVVPADFSENIRVLVVDLRNSVPAAAPA